MSRQRNVRRGLASMEVVMATAIGVPLAALLLVIGIKGAKLLYQVATTLVGWPYL